MATEPFRNSGEGGRTPGQSTQYEPGAKLMELLQSSVLQSSVLQSSVLSERSGFFMISVIESGKFVTQLEGSLRNILEKKLQSLNISDKYRTSLEEYLAQLNSNTGAFELQTIIKIAFKCIELSGLNKVDRTDLALFVVEIANMLEELMSTITRSKQVPYDTKLNFLYRFIQLMVKLILNVGYNYSEFRGRKPEMNSLDHPNNAFLGALDSAADALLKQVEGAGHQELIDTMNGLFNMTKSLRRPDELAPIYDKIRAISIMMVNGNIENYFKEQIEEIVEKIERELNRTI